jgi:hypothetical protein
MRPLALLLLATLVGCKVDTDKDRDKRVEDLKNAIRAQREPYMKTIADFLDATSKKDFERAYGLMAPSYTNMVTREQFVAGIATNKNFERQVVLDVYKTTNMSGTFTITCTFGDLGRAEISLIDTANGPRISAIVIGGIAALPLPSPPLAH